MLNRVYHFYRSHSIVILFANWKGPMREFLEKADFYSIIPEFHCFLCLHDAVVHARMLLLQESVAAFALPSEKEDPKAADNDQVDRPTDSGAVETSGVVTAQSAVEQTATVLATKRYLQSETSAIRKYDGDHGDDGYLFKQASKQQQEHQPRSATTPPTREETASAASDARSPPHGRLSPTGPPARNAGNSASRTGQALHPLFGNTNRAVRPDEHSIISALPDDTHLLWDGISAQQPIVYPEVLLGHQRQWIVYTQGPQTNLDSASDPLRVHNDGPDPDSTLARDSD